MSASDSSLAEPTRSSEPEISVPAARLPLAVTAFVFLGAVLLFAFEPMVGRILLPRFGGAFHVWTTSLTFFQGALVLAYGYAHWIAPRLGRWHLAVLALALPFLPPDAPLVDAVFGAAGPSSATASVAALLLTLVRTALVPFFVLATTSVVAQHWVARSRREGANDAYVLYAVSNGGSLAALFGYALLVEPWLGLRAQGRGFFVGYVAYVLLAVLAHRSVAPRARGHEVAVAVPISWSRAASWILLSAWPSALLLAVTHVITVDAGNVPLLWVLPLAAYLLTFVLAFSDRVRTPGWVRRLWPHFAAVGVFFFAGGTSGSVVLEVVLHVGVAFVVGWAAHAELYARRPEGSALTRYYLLVALGGWIGGAFVAWLAPFVFPGLWEYPIALAGLGVTLAWDRRADLGAWIRRAGPWPIALTLALLVAIGWKLVEGISDGSNGPRVIAMARSPYGIYHVVEHDGALGPVRDLVSGRTRHGRQVMEGSLRREPLSYYHREGPLGDIWSVLASRPVPEGVVPSRRIGAIGLGVGAIAAYLEPGDVLDVYEIDPLDVELARAHFRFLGDARGTLRVHIGDGRLALERESRERRGREFDLLLVDAFAGDAIPAHLLTIEAVRAYAARLADEGLLVVHVSNRFYELRPVLAAIARELGWPLRWKERRASEVARRSDVALEDPSVYVALWPSTAERSGWGPALEARGWRAFDLASGDALLFSDDFAPTLRALRSFGVP